MFILETANLPNASLEFALLHCNGKLNREATTVTFPDEKSVNLMERFVTGASKERYRLEDPVYHILQFFDLMKAWHYFCAFNPNARLPLDPYHGVDLVKTILAGLDAVQLARTKLKMRDCILAIIFKHFNSSLGREDAKSDAARAHRALIEYMAYHPIHKDTEEMILNVIYPDGDIRSREFRIVEDLYAAAIALRVPNNVGGNILHRRYYECQRVQPTLTKEAFLMSQVKALATTKFKTSWAHAVILPVWPDSVVRWAASFADTFAMRYQYDELTKFYNDHSPHSAVPTGSTFTSALTQPASLTQL